jgi:hypothetical protein
LEAHFWEHANSVHGIAAFGPQRINRKQKTPEGGHEDDHDALDQVADANAGSFKNAKQETASGKQETGSGNTLQF